jgi:hypothetical protein
MDYLTLAEALAQRNDEASLPTSSVALTIQLSMMLSVGPNKNAALNKVGTAFSGVGIGTSTLQKTPATK